MIHNMREIAEALEADKSVVAWVWTSDGFITGTVTHTSTDPNRALTVQGIATGQEHYVRCDDVDEVEIDA